jgi:hypothetical protein
MMRSPLRLLAVSLTLVCLAAALPSCKKAPTSNEKDAEEKRSQPNVAPKPETDRGRQTIQIFKGYQKQVVGSLKAALVGGGTTAAIPVCKEVSDKLADSFAELPNVKVRRVAVRNRNPAHTPDSFEAGIFREWEEGLASGSQPVAISRETDEGLRVMQPIMLGSRLCLRCHGDLRQMAPETVEMLKRLYPDDNATGFELGQLRGAFSAIWTEPETAEAPEKKAN